MVQVTETVYTQVMMGPTLTVVGDPVKRVKEALPDITTSMMLKKVLLIMVSFDVISTNRN